MTEGREEELVDGATACALRETEAGVSLPERAAAPLRETEAGVSLPERAAAPLRETEEGSLPEGAAAPEEPGFSLRDATGVLTVLASP